MLTPATHKAFSLPSDLPRSAIAVLASGGLHSAVLLAQSLDQFEAVYPIYGRFGLPWQGAEEQHLRRFLAAIRGPNLGRLKVLELSVDDVYDDNDLVRSGFSMEQYQPGEGSPERGRDVLLLSKAVVWSAVNGIAVLATAPIGRGDLAGDQETIFEQLESFVRMGMGQRVTIIRPLGGLTPQEVVALGRDLPLEFTFSCIQPVADHGSGTQHCGRCHKCIDRQQAFLDSGLVDRTRYAFGLPSQTAAGRVSR